MCKFISLVKNDDFFFSKVVMGCKSVWCTYTFASTSPLSPARAVLVKTETRKNFFVSKSGNISVVIFDKFASPKYYLEEINNTFQCLSWQVLGITTNSSIINFDMYTAKDMKYNRKLHKSNSIKSFHRFTIHISFNWVDAIFHLNRSFFLQI